MDVSAIDKSLGNINNQLSHLELKLQEDDYKNPKHSNFGTKEKEMSELLPYPEAASPEETEFGQKIGISPESQAVSQDALISSWELIISN